MKLTDPFPLEAHAWRVLRKTKDGSKATCAIYVDARDVQDRLDQVVGAGAWDTDIITTYFGQGDEPWVATCKLTINGVSKTDVGEGSSAKGAATDALKRAAVQWGIGRYLYSDTVLTGWFPIDTYGNFSKESDNQIRSLLQQKLQKIQNGVSSTQGGVVSRNGHAPTQATQATQAEPPDAPPPDIDFYAHREPPPEEDNWDAMWDGTGAVEMEEGAGGLADYFDETLATQLPVSVVKFVDEMRQKDRTSKKGDDFSPMSAKQYGFLCSQLDKGYGEDSHNAVLTVLLGRAIDKDHLPGWKVKEILDWTTNPKEFGQQITQLSAVARPAVEAYATMGG